jgi:outer membrane protein assembly factor BamB
VRDDWPGWRGRNGLGVRTNPLPLSKWDANSGVLWVAPVAGEGHSSPIVVADRVFLTSADQREQTLVLLAHDRKTGALLWKTMLARGGFMVKHHKNSHASATPVGDGKRIYVPYIANGTLQMAAVDVAGSIVWQRAIGPFVSEHGYASSPVLYKDLVIIAGDNQGSPSAADPASTSHLTALRTGDGETAWRVSRPLVPSYGTPVVAHLAGRDQLLLSGAERIVGHDPGTGKELWFYRWSALRTANSMACGPDCVFASAAWRENQIVCVRADGNGDVTDTHLVWKRKRPVTDVPSPLFHDGRLYLTTDRGIVTAMDAATGKEIWQNRLGDSISASPVLAGDVIFSTDESGATYLFKAGPQFELLATNALNDRTSASPALCGDHIFLRSARFLWCLDGKTVGNGLAQNGFARSGNPGNSGPEKLENRSFRTGSSPPGRKQVSSHSNAPASGRTWLVLAVVVGTGLLFALALVFVLSIVRLAVGEQEATPRKGQASTLDGKVAFAVCACKGCGKKLKVRQAVAGKVIKCPHCGKTFALS